MFIFLQYPFLQNALIAGACVAIVSALVGSFLVYRGLTFAGHALSHIGFAGAAGALVFGINPLLGMLATTLIAALGIGWGGRILRERDVTIGVIMTFLLGCGALFLSLYNGYAEQAYSILFGNLLGISHLNAVFTAIFSAVIVAVLALLFRPLLFSSFDPEVAAARGVPIRAIAIAFLLLTAITVSLCVQVVGVLLLFTLLVGPAATASRLTNQPPHMLLVATGLGLAYTWLGIWLAVQTNWPASFFIATLSFAVYIPIRLLPSENSSRVAGALVHHHDHHH